MFTPKSKSTNTLSQVVPGLSPLPCSLTEGGTLFNTDESPESVVYPVGGKQEAGGLLRYLLTHLRTHTCLMPFSLNWGKFQTNLLRLSHPVLRSLHRERARRREQKKKRKEKKKKKSGLGADLKTTPRGRSPCLKDTRPHYQIFTKTRSLCGGGRVW